MANYRTDAPMVIKDFLRFQKRNKDHSDKTIDEYFFDLRTFFRFIKMDRGAVPTDTPFDEIDISDVNLELIKGITKVDINSYVDYLRSDRIVNEGSIKETQGLSAAATQRKVACLKSFFAYYYETLNKLDRDPTLGVIVPKIKKTLPKYLTENESFRLLDAVKGINEERDYCILLLFLASGIRVSEIVGINVQDVSRAREEKDSSFLKIVGKGKKERQVFLSPACVEAIEDYLAVREQKYAPEKGHEHALFLSRKHARMSVDAVQDMVKKTMLAAGLNPYSPHKLRHTAATLMLQNGVDVRTLQEVLGHASLSTTQIYTHVDADALRTASRANPLSKGRRRKN